MTSTCGLRFLFFSYVCSKKGLRSGFDLQAKISFFLKSLLGRVFEVASICKLGFQAFSVEALPTRAYSQGLLSLGGLDSTHWRVRTVRDVSSVRYDSWIDIRKGPAPSTIPRQT